MFKTFLFLIGLFQNLFLFAQQDLIQNIKSRKTYSLNGKWQYIIDPLETGYYNYRREMRNENDREAYWNSDQPVNKTDRLEHKFIDKYSLNVPGDWNSQNPELLYYEGTVWYKKIFDYKKSNSGNRMFLHFGAVNYRADVFLNGKFLGYHKGGFTPFNFELNDSLLKEKGNDLVVKVDNRRYVDEIPTINSDWWNYGGITRDVNIIEVPSNFISDYFIHLKKGKNNIIEGWVKTSGKGESENVVIEIPELNIKKNVSVRINTQTSFTIQVKNIKLWSPELPKLYGVKLYSSTDKIEDKIGFRTISTQGEKLLLNGKPIFLRGICVHEEVPEEIRRAKTNEDASKLLGWVKELNANMVRLAHYPHNEYIVRMADSLGILIWSEIPVYWTIKFESNEVLTKAKTQLKEMILRDKNRAAVIIWSVGNETPVSEARNKFLTNLISEVRSQDSTRLVSAALEVHGDNKDENLFIIDDALGNNLDIVSVNEYLGWYWGVPTDCRKRKWDIRFKKPFFISETGAEALGGFYADTLTRWSEEFQEWYYREQLGMMKNLPSQFIGTSPWLLADFKSPRRNNQVYQEGWNNKGLIDQKGRKKKAFFVLKKYYEEMGRKFK